MKLFEELPNDEFVPDYIIITGDGKNELRVLRGLCKKINGTEISLYFPFSTRSGKTGLAALNALQVYSTRSRITSMIYIVDGDTFEGKSAEVEIKDYLASRGFEIIEISVINEALLIRCKLGDKEITLYCIISGPEIFIEQEVARFLKVCFGNEFNISNNVNNQTKVKFKKEIITFLKEKRVKLEDLISRTGIEKIKESFPNFCAVLNSLKKQEW